MCQPLSWFLLTHVYLFLSLLSLCQYHTFLPVACLSPWPQVTAPSHYQSHTMLGNLGCAVGQDRKLLDAKDIKWYEDADSLEPINTISPPSESLKSIPIHPFSQWPRP